VELHPFLDEVWQFFHVPPVLLGKHDAGHVRTLGLRRGIT
jgi:hypothetical protein